MLNLMFLQYIESQLYILFMNYYVQSQKMNVSHVIRNRK